MKLETFFEKFELFADAPDAVARMREVVLELAVQGKLVEQDLNDKPPAIPDSLDQEWRTEPPFEIPVKWTWTQLSQLADINGGFAFKSTNYSEEGMRVVRISDFDEFGFKNHKVVRHLFSPDLERFLLSPDNILIAMTGGTVGKSYYVRSLPEPMIVNQRVATIKISSQANPSFIDIIIKSKITQDTIRTAKNSTNDNISMGDIKGFLIPLPPLAEQKRIVAKVDELMALCDQLEAQQQQRETRHAALVQASLARFTQAQTPANLQFLFHPSYTVSPADLRKTILTLAVQGKLVPQDPKDEPAVELIDRVATEKARLQLAGKIGKNKGAKPINLTDTPFHVPNSWQWTKLADITELITKGSSPKWQGVVYVSKTEGILFITSENVGNYRLRKLDDLKYIEKRFNEIEPRSILKNGDLLMNLVGASIGRVAIYDLHDGANINQAVALIRLINLNNGICPDFLLHYLNSPHAIDYMLSSRVTNAQPNISLTDAREFAIPIPPLAEQHRIVAKVDELMALVDDLESQLATSRTVAQNLMAALVQELTTVH